MSDIIKYNGSVPDTREMGVSIRSKDPSRGKDMLVQYGYNPSSEMYREYESLVKQAKCTKEKRAFVAKFILSTFQVIKLSSVKIFYIGNETSPFFKRLKGDEQLGHIASLWYQLFFGFDSDIGKIADDIMGGILPYDNYASIDRSYIRITDEFYWSRMSGDIVRETELPQNTRVFAKMFDTDVGDKNVYKIEEFDSEDIDVMLDTYETLKDIEYRDWPEEYHLQCFKDWSDGDIESEFGMFSVLAFPYLRVLPRGSIFNSGTGHNGKSILNGLAITLLGANNVSGVNGKDLGNWDYLIDLQTTWMNCAGETKVDFLKDDTDTFKILAAHETLSMRRKYGDSSVPIVGDFPMIFNINEVPDFGQDASAILSRMFVNEFKVDFEVLGRADPDYFAHTFLSDKKIIPMITGMVFAFSHYYSQEGNIWKPSEPMIEKRSSMEESAVPKRRYFTWLTAFFDSYSGIKIPKKDFINFGMIEGENYDGGEIKAKDMQFSRFTRRSTPKGVLYKIDNKSIFGCRRFFMCDKMYIRKYMGAMNLEEYHNNGNSIVHAMMIDFLSRKAKIEAILKNGGQKIDKRGVEKQAMQEMLKDIEYEQRGASYGEQ